jgi:peptidoglycan L-alanyl-D-glutamate endopeptidase CwlK
MSYKWGTTSKERIEGVHGLLIELITRSLSISQHDMFIPGSGGVRTADEQNVLFKKGFSQMDGFEKKSYHQSGLAVDVVPVKDAYNNAGGFRHFAKCMFRTWQLMIKEGKVSEKYYLEYGGHWTNFVDVPHWQLKIR